MPEVDVGRIFRDIAGSFSTPTGQQYGLTTSVTNGNLFTHTLSDANHPERSPLAESFYEQGDGNLYLRSRIGESTIQFPSPLLYLPTTMLPGSAWNRAADVEFYSTRGQHWPLAGRFSCRMAVTLLDGTLGIQEETSINHAAQMTKTLMFTKRLNGSWILNRIGIIGENTVFLLRRVDSEEVSVSPTVSHSNWGNTDLRYQGPTPYTPNYVNTQTF